MIWITCPLLQASTEVFMRVKVAVYTAKMMLSHLPFDDACMVVCPV